MSFRTCPECGSENTSYRCDECGRIERTPEQIAHDVAEFQLKREVSSGLTSQDALSLLERTQRERDAEIDRLMGLISAASDEVVKLRKERDNANALFDALCPAVHLQTLINPESLPSLATYIRERYARERDQWKANHDQRKQERDLAISERDAAVKECERMRPVYEAAVRLRSAMGERPTHDGDYLTDAKAAQDELEAVVDRATSEERK